MLSKAGDDRLFACRGGAFGGTVENGGDDVFNPVDDHGPHQMGAVDEALITHVIDQVEHRVPETFDIGEDHRLFMAAELGPGHDLDNLFQRPDTARQRDEGIGTLEHHVLALMHVLGNDQLIKLTERMTGRLHVHEKFGNDPRHLPAGGKHAAGNGAHDALGAAAIDETQAVGGDGGPQLTPGLDKGSRASGLGTAINADGSNRRTVFTHGPREQRLRNRVKEMREKTGL